MAAAVLGEVSAADAVAAVMVVVKRCRVVGKRGVLPREEEDHEAREGWGASRSASARHADTAGSRLVAGIFSCIS